MSRSRASERALEYDSNKNSLRQATQTATLNVDVVCVSSSSWHGVQALEL